MTKRLFSEVGQGKSLSEELNLVEAAMNDPAAFAKLYSLYIRRVYRYIISKVGETKEAEDITSQVFLSICEGLPRYRHNGYFAAWLFSIARNKVADHFRSKVSDRKKEVAYMESIRTDDPLSTIIRNEEIDRISALIHIMDEQDQELLRLRIVAELTFEEIAQLTNRNMEATKKRFYKLLSKFRQQRELDHD
jgi:RNA polymerase sigma-70 factor, ECF subfamily